MILVRLFARLIAFVVLVALAAAGLAIKRFCPCSVGLASSEPRKTPLLSLAATAS